MSDPQQNPDDPYELVVLGAGSAGYAAALRAAQHGLSVALVERDRLGGTCLHRGCIPTKAWLHVAEVADAAREGRSFGVRSDFEGIDTAAVERYRSGVIDRLHGRLRSLIGQGGIDLVPGDGAVTSPTAVRVGDRLVEGRHLLLATGSAPSILPGVSVDGRRVLTSEHALALDAVPTDVLVLGGGVIGVEFASLWNSLGATVTIIEAEPRLLPAQEPASSTALARSFRRRGIRLELGCAVEDVKVGDDEVTLTLSDGRTTSAAHLLVAIGRTPAGDALDVRRLGVGVTRGAVEVDEFCLTSVPTLSSAGDLIHTPQLAHVGFAEGLLVADRLAGEDPLPIDYAGVPHVVYCRPELASVGLTSAQAEAVGYDVAVSTYDLAANGKSLILSAPGLVTVVAAKDGPVLGVHIVAERASELIAESQLIVNWAAQADEVARLVHPHPTLIEAVGEAHLALAGKPLHRHG